MYIIIYISIYYVDKDTSNVKKFHVTDKIHEIMRYNYDHYTNDFVRSYKNHDIL